MVLKWLQHIKRGHWRKTKTNQFIQDFNIVFRKHFSFIILSSYIRESDVLISFPFPCFIWFFVIPTYISHYHFVFCFFILFLFASLSLYQSLFYKCLFLFFWTLSAMCEFLALYPLNFCWKIFLLRLTDRPEKRPKHFSFF